ncbi:M23 family metallopeptidase [Streptomyces sp. NPDC056004]|uniref:M23 family metallopeptidase n=1 Tax=Streptomyces sp. NPDC056004 TaxID=3345677 RepID=UPI0035DAB00D
MNDQHPHAGYAGYDSDATGSFDSDPLFGSLPGGHDGTYGSGYGAGQSGYSGQYDSTQWDTGAHPTTSYDAYTAYPAQPQQQYEAGPTYDTTAIWTPAADYGTETATATATATFAGIPAQGGAPDATAQWDTSVWQTNDPWATGETAVYDSGVYDATAWNTGATPEHEQQIAQPSQTTETAQVSYEAQSAHEALGTHETYADPGSYDLYDPYAPYAAATAANSTTDAGIAADKDDIAADAAAADDVHDAATISVAAITDVAEAVPEPRRSVGRSATRGGGAGRSRRRSPAKRSALLTVAIPSACVMSVAGIAAASVAGLGGEDKKDDNTTMAAADPDSVKPVAANNKLDTQLANLSADAENFADRASRTQERIDLRERQAAEKKKREEEAARKEALRPKFVMPVERHGLSAYFGQAGVNWMSVHTGIDFPVLQGTPVMAATDGTVRTQLNSAYGNMAIVTMADGTETWYCHLSATKIRSGPVKAGDVIAYSGDTGNSTGPHLHFEVRPGGGAAVDPLPWLRSHGVNPT